MMVRVIAVNDNVRQANSITCIRWNRALVILPSSKPSAFSSSISFLMRLKCKERLFRSYLYTSGIQRSPGSEGSLVSSSFFSAEIIRTKNSVVWEVRLVEIYFDLS